MCGGEVVEVAREIVARSDGVRAGVAGAVVGTTAAGAVTAI